MSWSLSEKDPWIILPSLREMFANRRAKVASARANGERPGRLIAGASRSICGASRTCRSRERQMVRNFMRPAASLAVVCGALAGFAAWAPGGAQTVLGIEVLSSRPELVSGGDALVRISGVAAAPQVTVGASD